MLWEPKKRVHKIKKYNYPKNSVTETSFLCDVIIITILVLLIFQNCFKLVVNGTESNPGNPNKEFSFTNNTNKVIHVTFV